MMNFQKIVVRVLFGNIINVAYDKAKTNIAK